MDAAAAASRIADLELLKALPDDARSQTAEVFLDVSDVLAYEDGESLITEGFLSFGTGYALVDGVAVVELANSDYVELTAPTLLGEMAQFRAADMRSATVRAKGRAVAAQFYWDDLYRAAEVTLPDAVHQQFRQAVEKQMWERFQHKNITQIALLSGIPDDVRERVCMPLPSLSDQISLGETDTLFSEGANCKRTGYLLVVGKLRLFRKDKSEKIIEAPDIVGVFPNKSEKSQEWSATAMAQGSAEVLKFSWEQYSDQLVRRLSRDEQETYINSLRDNRSKHFLH